MIGHNNGPPLEDPTNTGGFENAYSWRKAHKRAWQAPSAEVALLRARAAEQLGLTYKDYAAIQMDRGRAPTALFFDLGGTLVRTRNNEIAVDRHGAVTLMPGVRSKFERLGSCALFVVTNQARIADGSLTEGDVEDVIAQVGDQTRQPITDYCIGAEPLDSKYELRPPGAGLIKRMLSKHLLQPAQGVMIADTVAHEQSALSAGLARFLWAWRYFSEPIPAPT